MAKRRAQREAYFDCPSCGARLRVGAKFCRECGADEESGWSEDEDAYAWSSDLPTGYATDEDDDGDEWRPEGAIRDKPWGHWTRPFWFLLLLLAALALLGMLAR